MIATAQPIEPKQDYLYGATGASTYFVAEFASGFLLAALPGNRDA